jgi:hypothetical protein
MINGIRPETGFSLPDIRLDTGTENSQISGQIENKTIPVHKIFINVNLKTLLTKCAV